MCDGTWLSWGSSRATAFQMAPVPPFRGNLNTALGPHPASSCCRMTVEIARVMSTVATLSPSQSHCIAVVGYAHTWQHAHAFGKVLVLNFIGAGGMESMLRMDKWASANVHAVNRGHPIHNLGNSTLQDAVSCTFHTCLSLQQGLAFHILGNFSASGVVQDFD